MVLYALRGVPAFLFVVLNLSVFLLPLLAFATVKALARGSAGARALMDRGMLWIHESAVALDAWMLWGPRRPLAVEAWPELRRDGWYMLVCNHQSWADIFVLQTLMNRRGPLLRWMVKRPLRWLPLVGQIAWAYDYPFLHRHSRAALERCPELAGADAQILARHCQRFQANPGCLINFAEGTRHSPDKEARSGSPFPGLLAPKAGGAAMIFEAMGPTLLGVVDVTIAYERPGQRFWGFMGGTSGETAVHARLIPAAELPLGIGAGPGWDGRAAAAAWINGVWAEKARTLARLRGRWLAPQK